MKKYNGKITDYRTAEGKSVNAPYRGDVKQTALDILGGLRSILLGNHHIRTR